jgi:hypothetical protein
VKAGENLLTIAQYVGTSVAMIQSNYSSFTLHIVGAVAGHF